MKVERPKHGVGQGNGETKNVEADLLQQNAVDTAEVFSAIALYTHPSGHTPGMKLRRLSGITWSHPEG